MRIKDLLSILLAAVLGAAFGAAIKLAYAVPNYHPTDGFYYLFLDSPLGRYAPEPFGEIEILIHIAIRASSYSVLAGVIAGVMLRKLSFQRTFCYSALWVPVLDIAYSYLDLYASSVVDSVDSGIIQKRYAKEFWIDAWVYSWYYCALFAASFHSRRLSQRRTGTAQIDARDG